MADKRITVDGSGTEVIEYAKGPAKEVGTVAFPSSAEKIESETL
jgi:hypothetical protein